MQLTYHSDFTLRVLIYLLDHPGERVTTRRMAEFFGISLHHLTKVAKALTRVGWVVASRGGGGGLALAPHAAKLTVGEVLRHTESMNLLECFDPARNTCPIICGCRLKPMLHRARQAFLGVLDGYAISDLAESTRGARELAAVNLPEPPRLP